jgi:hypothetical protein
VVVLLGACSQNDEKGPSSLLQQASNQRSAAWLNTRDSIAVRKVTIDDSVCTSCLRLDKVAELGRADDPNGYVQHAFRLYRDSRARYWLVQGSVIKLFDHAGTFMRTVGSPGSGPGEWRSPWPATDMNGRVQVIDASNGRVTRLDGDFGVTTETPIPALEINAVAPIGPEAFVVNAWAVAADMIGQPMHVFDGGRMVRSFGTGEDAVQTRFTSRRVIDGDGRGHVVLSKPYSLEIEAWTDKGERILGATGPALNDHAVLPAAYDFDRNPLPNEVRGIRLDSIGRLWILTWRVKANWKDRWEERVYPNGSKGIVPKSDGSPQDYRFSRIEVLDLTVGKVIAQADFPQILSGFVGRDEVWENPLPDDEQPMITVWRLHEMVRPR